MRKNIMHIVIIAILSIIFNATPTYAALMCNYEGQIYPICYKANAWSYENGAVCVGISRCIAQQPPYGVFSSTATLPPSSTPKTTSLPVTTSPPSSTPKTTSPPVTTSLPHTTATPKPGLSGIRYLITFGDSYTDTGFEHTGGQPSSSNPMGNPPFPGRSWSGGANWVSEAVSTYKAELTYSFNYARSGAAIDNNIVSSWGRPLVDQIGIFKQHIANHPATASWTSENALFCVWIGINDLGNAYYNSGTVPSIITRLFDQYFTQMEYLYSQGARHFVFFNIPPTDRTPSLISQGSSSQALLKSTISQYNSELMARAQTFALSHNGVEAHILDTHTLFTNILNQGGNAATCSNADGITCLWYDTYHPGNKIHQEIAKALASQESWFFKV